VAASSLRRLGELSDPELAEAAQHGDDAALAVLLARYRRFVRAKSRGYFIVGADHDDLEQEALIGLFKAVRDFQPAHLSSFRSFAELCITRQVITAIKTATRKKHQPLNQYISISADASADQNGSQGDDEILLSVAHDDPADLLVAAERMASMGAALGERLSELELDVLARYVAGQSYRDIGEQLGRHSKSIDNAIQRIKRKFGEHLEQEAATATADELALTG